MKRKKPNRCVDCGAKISYRATRCHSCSSKALWADTEYQEKVSDGMKQAWERGGGLTSEERSRRISEVIRAAHARGAYGEEWRESKSKSMTQAWAREDNKLGGEEWRENLSAAIKAAYARGAYVEVRAAESARERQSEIMRDRWAQGYFDGMFSDPEYRRELSERIKQAWRDGKINGEWSEERRAKLAQAVKENWARGVYDDVFVGPSDIEATVSDALDALGVQHVSQFRPDGVSYVYDEYIPDANLLLEVDGEFWHHSEWAIENGAAERDRDKDEVAKGLGYNIVRIRGSEIHAADGVVTLVAGKIGLAEPEVASDG